MLVAAGADGWGLLALILFVFLLGLGFGREI